MKRVGIITINSDNYGNRLQNYALQQVLSGLGFESYTIPRKRPIDSYIKRSLIGIKNCIRSVARTKKGVFLRFNNRYIRYSSAWASATEYSNGLAEEFDYFIVGSDQVWNPIYSDLPHKPVGICDLLVFAKSEQKISYASSFGIDFIPPQKRELFCNCLSDFRAISVREYSGLNIVRNLLGRECEVVLDPTLLLEAKQWNKIKRNPLAISLKSYVLMYFLDGKGNIAEREEKKIAGREIIDINEINKSRRFAAIGPCEFLALIDSADEVWTNSFHATVFSLIFHKHFRTFPREGIDMSSRIKTLATITGIDNCFDNEGILDLRGDVDFNSIDRNIYQVREKSMVFLRDALYI